MPRRPAVVGLVLCETLAIEPMIRRCLFPAPGRYALSLRFDGQELTHHYLSVYPTEE